MKFFNGFLFTLIMAMGVASGYLWGYKSNDQDRTSVRVDDKSATICESSNDLSNTEIINQATREDLSEAKRPKLVDSTASPIENKKASFVISKLYLENASKEDLVFVLQNLVNYRADDFQSIPNIKSHAEGLIDIYHKNLDGAQNEGLTFSSGILADSFTPKNPTHEYFSGTTNKIFTWFENPQKKPILVKWRKKGEQQPLLFKKFDADGRTKQNVWFQPDKGWKKGEYVVEVYDAYSLENIGYDRFKVR